MTLPELLLYTELKKQEVTMGAAIHKAGTIARLPVEHYLALAQIRSAAG